MPTITKSIGTTSRDYSTITAWEADLDNSGVYTSGDDAVGECYADSTFAETPSINGGGTVGLASVTLSVAAGNRHDGTEGTGANTSGGLNVNVPSGFNQAYTVEWLDISLGSSSVGFGASASGNVGEIRHALIHDTFAANGFISAFTRDALVHNCIMYNASRDGSTIYGVSLDGDRAEGGFFNNTVHNVENTNTLSSTCVGVRFATDSAVTRVKNNVVILPEMDPDVSVKAMEFAGSATNGDYNYNATSDSTANDPGTSNNLVNIVASDQFISITAGSEDLHLKSGADAINAGTDLGTTPTGVNIDIDGRDRDAEGDTWDIGADEFVSAGGATSSYYNAFLHSIIGAG